MKANELRFGNKMNFKVSVDSVETEFGIGEVTGINKEAVWINGIKIPIEYLVPISITEELLIKFGFKDVKPRSGIAAAYLLNGVRIHMSNSGNWYYKKRLLHGLHDLQNLYFALREEELKTNN